MKKKSIILITTTVLLLSVVVTYKYIKEQSKPLLVLKENSIKIKPYSFLEKETITNAIDQEKSKYDTIEIIMIIEDKEYNIKNDLQNIYDLYQIDLKDEGKIPVGEKAEIKLRAFNRKNSIETKLELEIEEIKDFVIQTADGMEFKDDYDLKFGSNIEYLKKPKVFVNYFGNYSKEIKAETKTNADSNKAGNYELKIIIPELDKNIVSKIHIKEKESIVDVDPVLWADLSKLTVLVNKKYHLKRESEPVLTTFPKYYAVDSDYRAQGVAVDAFIKLVYTMESETGMSLRVTSSYRPYSSQERLFNNYVAKNGLEEARKFAAKPGESEHQTGLAIDVVKRGAEGSMFEFAKTKESEWLANNADRFGFIIRYPEGKESITGYQYEAWHIRYLGNELASKVKNSGLTYDEYWEKYLK